ncbi:transposase [Nocardioides sp. Y6]|uniref:Transposase n=1 Tax=Nocardioides malaquae TaxID=2773426 RepID=A0ABR9RP18_9ACTN|nr:transposase [Nocardioides malaquae]MBE7323323.1 transposase [Nocardioides malaquae]
MNAPQTEPHLRALVLTADQRSSRTSTDAVPQALGLLDHVPTLRSWERTAGDEFQGLLDSPAALTEALLLLMRDGRWHVGVGVGRTETPLPPSTRAGRGPAYVDARRAVERARTSAHHVAVEGDAAWCRHLESALWLWHDLLDRRSEKGWQVVDLLAQGLTHERVAATLGVSQSAVSQRASAAALAEELRARELVTALATLCLEDR